MRILLILPSLDKNGANVTALNRAKYWAESGHTVDLLVIESETHVERNRDWVPQLNSLHQCEGIYPVFRPRTFFRLLKPVRLARRADLVVSGVEIGQCLYIGALAAKIAQRPLSVFVQNNIDEALRLYVREGRFTELAKWSLRQADLLICVSEALVGLTEKYCKSSASIKTVTNGIDFEKLRSNATRPISKTLPDGPFLMGLGRLSDQKGFDLLLEAYAKALKSNPGVPNLVIAGEGPDENELRERANQLGIADRVHLLGFVDNPGAALEKAGLFVLSSRFEGYPLVLAEAMAFGVPIIAFDCPTGPREILQNGALGRLVPATDVETFASAIVEHVNDPTVLQHKADQARQTCDTRFDPYIAAQRHLEYLQSMFAPSR